ncbi:MULTISPECIES: TetR/AcrR family transcriptional regulator [unclassified Brevibacterium]|uniref:TetR/AcrR family transcriptional regulator n=1 Tax=unclassified Brevibacterium TaxID=2614124 RepID=UPI001081DDA8|nr:TetR/AcrR family transcriptional regulator [Brevibacterium sp. S111]TGD08925.1 TetR/AcrR family transcriptional regulator [Brevibacterium sp. S111]
MTDTRDGKHRLADALTRVVAREGITGVSVRAVAAEAGVSGGTVQHYFPTRAEMIRYAMEWTSTQVEKRLVDIPRWGEVREWTGRILLDLLPLSADRRREHAVWLAFVAHADTDPLLADLKRQTSIKLHELYSGVIRARRGLPVHTEKSTAVVDHDFDADAVLLQSVVDGLSLHLADLELDEAARVGPKLLDRYLALAVDSIDGPTYGSPGGGWVHSVRNSPDR